MGDRSRGDAGSGALLEVPVVMGIGDHFALVAATLATDQRHAAKRCVHNDLTASLTGEYALGLLPDAGISAIFANEETL